MKLIASYITISFSNVAVGIRETVVATSKVMLIVIVSNLLASITYAEALIPSKEEIAKMNSRERYNLYRDLRLSQEIAKGSDQVILGSLRMRAGTYGLEAYNQRGGAKDFARMRDEGVKDATIGQYAARAAQIKAVVDATAEVGGHFKGTPAWALAKGYKLGSGGGATVNNLISKDYDGATASAMGMVDTVTDSKSVGMLSGSAEVVDDLREHKYEEGLMELGGTSADAANIKPLGSGMRILKSGKEFVDQGEIYDDLEKHKTDLTKSTEKFADQSLERAEEFDLQQEKLDIYADLMEVGNDSKTEDLIAYLEEEDPTLTESIEANGLFEDQVKDIREEIGHQVLRMDQGENIDLKDNVENYQHAYELDNKKRVEEKREVSKLESKKSDQTTQEPDRFIDLDPEEDEAMNCDGSKGGFIDLDCLDSEDAFDTAEPDDDFDDFMKEVDEIAHDANKDANRQTRSTTNFNQTATVEEAMSVFQSDVKYHKDSSQQQASDSHNEFMETQAIQVRLQQQREALKAQRQAEENQNRGSLVPHVPQEQQQYPTTWVRCSDTVMTIEGRSCPKPQYSSGGGGALEEVVVRNNKNFINKKSRGSKNVKYKTNT